MNFIYKRALSLKEKLISEEDFLYVKERIRKFPNNPEKRYLKKNYKFSSSLMQEALDFTYKGKKDISFDLNRELINLAVSNLKGLFGNKFSSIDEFDYMASYKDHVDFIERIIKISKNYIFS